MCKLRMLISCVACIICSTKHEGTHMFPLAVWNMALIPLCAAQPHFQFEDLGVGNVIARLDFRAAAAEGRLRGSVGSILNFEGFSVQVHWLDGTQSTVALEEVRSDQMLPPAAMSR